LRHVGEFTKVPDTSCFYPVVYLLLCFGKCHYSLFLLSNQMVTDPSVISLPLYLLSQALLSSLFDSNNNSPQRMDLLSRSLTIAVIRLLTNKSSSFDNVPELNFSVKITFFTF
jgi:hypothetical protein